MHVCPGKLDITSRLLPLLDTILRPFMVGGMRYRDASIRLSLEPPRDMGEKIIDSVSLFQPQWCCRLDPDFGSHSPSCGQPRE
jgi:hypothetical protein